MAAAHVGAVGLQTVCDWVLRFNDAGPVGLLTGKAPGPQPCVADHHRVALRQVVEDGPIPAVHGVVRWRIADLLHWLWNEFHVSVSKQTLSRELRALGFRTLSARPRHHAKDPGAAEAFKKFPALLAQIAAHEAAGKLIEAWWQDEARIGQKNKTTRRWARRGTRPASQHDQRTRSAYPPGPGQSRGPGAAALHERGDDAAPAGDRPRRGARGAHAVVLLDQAGWHTSAKLPVPGNITLLPLPTKSPELNPVESIWQYMRDNWLSNRIFASYQDILDHRGFAWNSLVEQPWTIISIGLRDWAHRS